MNPLILIILLVGAIAFGVYEQREASSATTAAKLAQEELAVAQGQLENVESRIDAAKKEASDARDKVREIDKVKTELAAAQKSLEEAAKEAADSQAAADDMKKQMAEVDILKEKVTAAEVAVTAAKEEVAAAKAEAAAARAEAAQVKAAASKPPLGGATDKRLR